MKIASFNINGIKARIGQLTAWLPEAQPDVVVLQEIKTVDEGFPAEMIEDLGWKVWTHGQKSWNGVAVLSRLPVEEIRRGLPGDDADEQRGQQGALHELELEHLSHAGPPSRGRRSGAPRSG